MKIDYISDLHADFWAKHDKNVDKWLLRTNEFCQSLLPDELGEVLIIAGDLAHYNLQSSWILEFFSKRYKQVIMVLGNHDYYLVSNSQEKKYNKSSNLRVKELKDIIKTFKNVKLLDKFKIFEYNGIKFSGSTSWYPVETNEEIHFFYKISNDSKHILGFNLLEKRESEMNNYDKLEIDEVDVIVTHVPPIYTDSTRKYNSNACYLNKLESKASWYVFGHTHENMIYQDDYSDYMVNAVGYNGENLEKQIKTFEV